MELGKRLKTSSSRLSQRQKLGLERTWFNEVKRMDKLYIPGDLVMTNGAPIGTEQDVVYRVTSSDPSKTLKLGDGTVMKGVVRLENLEGVEFGDKGYLFGDCCAWVKDIVPIPITPEILQKNGWDKEGKDGSDFSLSEAFMGGDENDEDNYTCFQLYYQNKKDGWVIDMRGEPLQFEIHYIHELQHLFFGLGLNSEMEV